MISPYKNRENYPSSWLSFSNRAQGKPKVAFALVRAMSAEEKGEPDNTITVTVNYENDAPMFFKIKKETKMSKVMAAYANRKGNAVGSLKFMFDGNRLNDNDTPKMLEMEEGDQIDVYLEQTGGGEDGDAEAGKEKQLTIVVKNTDGDEMFFKVKKETKMSKIFEAYAQRKGIASNSLKFLLDGDRIQGDSTPKMLELEDNDQIDVVIDQLGGGEAEGGGENTLTLVVKDQTGAELQFKVKKETKLQRVMEAYANSKGVDMNSLRFTIDGDRIRGDQTPKMLEMEDMDQIDVALDMVGGH